jgi:hypothetical protein
LKKSIFIIVVTLFSCAEKKAVLSKTFEGLFVETIWRYTFNPDGRFTFQSEGHYGDTTVDGTYILSDSVIFLNPETEWDVRNGVLKTKLKIIDSTCVRDYDANYYCTTSDAVNNHIDEEMTFQSRVIAILDSISVVKNERLKINADKDDLTDVEIRYGGIIVIKNEEHHFFYLSEFNLQETITHLTFVVRKDPFEIYQHSLQGDRLELLPDSR